VVPEGFGSRNRDGAVPNPLAFFHVFTTTTLHRDLVTRQVESYRRRAMAAATLLVVDQPVGAGAVRMDVRPCGHGGMAGLGAVRGAAAARAASREASEGHMPRA